MPVVRQTMRRLVDETPTQWHTRGRRVGPARGRTRCPCRCRPSGRRPLPVVLLVWITRVFRDVGMARVQVGFVVVLFPHSVRIGWFWNGQGIGAAPFSAGTWSTSSGMAFASPKSRQTKASKRPATRCGSLWLIRGCLVRFAILATTIPALRSHDVGMSCGGRCDACGTPGSRNLGAVG